MTTFNPRSGLIRVYVELHGPRGIVNLTLALDTGATRTVIAQAKLLQAGYDPAASSDRVRVATGSGIEYPHRLNVVRLESLGLDKTDFSVVAHTLPRGMGIDGLLGLDFLRDRKLTIDFPNGTIDIE